MVPWRLGRKRPQVLGTAPERRTHRKPDRLCNQRWAPNPSPGKVVPNEGTQCVPLRVDRAGLLAGGERALVGCGREFPRELQAAGCADTPHACPCLRYGSQIVRDRPPHVPVPGWGERGFSPSARLAVTAAGCGDGSPGRCARVHGDRTARSRGAAQPGMRVGAAGRFTARSPRRKECALSPGPSSGGAGPSLPPSPRFLTCVAGGKDAASPGRVRRHAGFSSRVALSFWSRCSVADEQEVSTRLHRRGQRGSWHAACRASPGQPALLGLAWGTQQRAVVRHPAGKGPDGPARCAS